MAARKPEPTAATLVLFAGSRMIPGVRPTTMISYAQNFEDVLLWRVLNDVAAGCYVDVGAFHPEIDSVTKWFYDAGWSGVNIEPVPASHALLVEARPRDINIRAAAGAASGHGHMTVPRGSHGLASLHPTGTENDAASDADVIDVEIRPLHELLETLGTKTIHFLKIDAEGSERDVLLGMDFVRYRPWIVVIEATVPRSQERASAAWSDLLTGAGYRLAWFDGLNEFYVAHEKEELASRLSHPPNVFDDFVPASVVRWRDQCRELEGRLTEAATLIDRQTNELAELHRVADERQRLLTQRNQEIRDQEALMAVLRGDLVTMAQSLEALREDHRRLINSSSWRLTAPLRRIRGHLAR